MPEPDNDPMSGAWRRLPDDDPRMREVRERIGSMVDRLLAHLRGPSFHAMDTFKSGIARVLIERAAAEGVFMDVAQAALDFDLTMEGPDTLLVVPRNMFTLLLSMGIVRDPEMLKAFVAHEENPEFPGAWKETFKDERGIYILAFVDGGFETIVIPNDPMSFIQTSIEIDKDSDS